MASSSTRDGRLRILLSGLVLTALALPWLSASASEQEQPVDDDLCPYLRSERRVSYKRQEFKLFRRVVKQVESSPATAPSAHDVVRTFEACLKRFHEQAEGKGSSSGDSPSEAGSDAVAQLRFDVSADGTKLEAAYGESPPRTYKTRGELANLANRVTRGIVDQVEPRRRDELRNQLWFLWIESYLRATGQKYNSYDYASDLTEEQAEDRGRSFTVGFEVKVLAGRMRVSDVNDDRLRAAGLATGDEVVGLGDQVVNEMTLPELQHYWLNPEPFTFTVVVRHENEQRHIAGESVPTRHSTLAWSIRGELGYVRIREFNRGSLIELRRALRALEAEQISRLILDLRDNPGGTLSTGLVDVFFKPGQTLVSYRGYGAKEAVDVDATVEYWGIPAAVLVNRHTASMAEILTAAFQTHDRGPLVGERTRGKGVGQSLYSVLDEGRLHLVNRTYYYPGTRKTWNEIGITPTLEIELGEEERDRLQPHLDSHVLRLDEQWEVDPVLRAAERQLREQP